MWSFHAFFLTFNNLVSGKCLVVKIIGLKYSTWGGGKYLVYTGEGGGKWAVYTEYFRVQSCVENTSLTF